MQPTTNFLQYKKKKKKKKTYYSFPHYKSNKIKIKIPTSHHDVHRIPRHIRIQIKVYNQWYFIHDTLPFYKFSPSIYNIINISTFTVSILSNEEDAPFFSFLLALAASSEKINIDFVCEIMNFGSLNLIILNKKSKNITKYHNIFTISSFLKSEYIYIYIYFFFFFI